SPTKTFGADEVCQRGIGFLPPYCEIATGLSKLLLAGAGLAQMLEYVGGEDIEIASRSKLVRGRFQLPLDPVLLGIAGDLGEGGNGSAQAAQTNTHLVQCFGVARAHPWLIGDDLMETIMHDGTKGLPTRHAWVKLNRFRFFKGLVGIFD